LGRGWVRQNIVSSFASSIIDVDDSYRQRFDYSQDVATFCEDYKADQLFHHVPGRYHSAFKGFIANRGIVEGKKLKERLMKYAQKLDQLKFMQGKL